MPPFLWKVQPCIYHASLSLERTIPITHASLSLDGNTLHLPRLSDSGRYYPAFTIPPFPARYFPTLTMPPFPWKVLACIDQASLSLEGSPMHWPCLPFPGRYYPALTMPPFPWMAVPSIYHVLLCLKGPSVH